MPWKKILGIVSLLAVILLVALWVILESYDYNTFKPRVARMVKAATGRELNLGGDINLAVGLSPALVVTQVALANASWGSTSDMVQADRLQAQVRLLPLLSGKVEVTSIGIFGARVSLETDPSGRGNWDFTGGARPTKESDTSALLGAVHVENIRIQNLDLTFREGKTGATKRFNLARLELARPRSRDGLALHLQAKWNGQPVEVSGDIGTIHSLFSEKPFPVQLSGRVSHTAVEIDGAIEDLRRFHGVDFNARVSGENLGEVGLLFGATLPTTDAFTVQGRVKGSAKALSLHEAKGSAARGSLRLALDGEMQDLLGFGGMDLKLHGSGKDLAEVGGLFETKLPTVGPLDVNARLTGSAAAFSLDDFSAKIDRSDFNGSVKVAFRKRPKISSVLKSSVVDLTPLMKELENEDKAPDTENIHERRLFSRTPLPFDALTKVDADFELEVGTIRVRDAQLDSGHLTLTLQDGRIRVKDLKASYQETQISGKARLGSGPPPQVAVTFLVQNFDLGGFYKETGTSEQVEGHVDIAADVKSTGDSVHALMADLDGTIGAVMGKGYLTHYLDLISMDLSRKVLPFWGHHEGAKQVKCAVVQFDLETGVATSRAFVFDTEVAVLTGEGTINLGTEQVDFLLAPKPKHPSLTSLATKLHVSGTIMDPKVNPEIGSLAIKGAKALSALAVGPVGLLAPFVTLGAHQKHPCDIGSITQIGLEAPGNE